MDAAPRRLSYAEHLDGFSTGLGLFYLLFGAVFTFFVLYVAYSYVMVARAAFINAIMLLFAAPLAMIDGAPAARAAPPSPSSSATSSSCSPTFSTSRRAVIVLK